LAQEQMSFFEAVINAGAILAGFCSTFLAFRIQRESGYYRQPAVNFETAEAKDVHIGLTHFTSAFFLIISASAVSILFGFLIPLLGLAGVESLFISPAWVVAGLIASVVLLAGYFVDEMLHYRILSSKLLNDAREWKNELVIVLVAALLSILCGYIAYLRVP